MSVVRALLATLALTPAIAGCASIPWPAPTAAAPGTAPDARPRDAAVVVAIEHYRHHPRVRGAGLNADDWRRYLFDVRGLASDRVHVLRDDAATRERIVDRIERAVRQTADGGRVWFVFIGHGAPREKADAQGAREGLLIAVDAEREKASIGGNSLGQYALSQKLAGREHVAILDTCFSGRDRQGDALNTDQPLVWPDVKSAPTGVVLTAGKGDETAGLLTKSLRPAFSYLALGALQGWCEGRFPPEPGVADDGRVTAVEVARCAADAIGQVNRGQQTPQAHGTGRDSMALAAGVRAGFDFDGMIHDVVAGDPPPRLGPWLLVGSGLSLLALGGAAHYVNHHDGEAVTRLRSDALEAVDGEEDADQSSIGEYNRQRTALNATKYASIAGYATGGALLVGGLIWRLALRGEDRDWIAIAPSPGGVVLGGRF